MGKLVIPGGNPQGDIPDAVPGSMCPLTSGMNSIAVGPGTVANVFNRAPCITTCTWFDAERQKCSVIVIAEALGR